MLRLSVVPPVGRLNDAGWELCPDALGNVGHWLTERYPGTPLHITEIGAIADAADLRSCFAWAFTDSGDRATAAAQDGERLERLRAPLRARRGRSGSRVLPTLGAIRGWHDRGYATRGYCPSSRAGT